MSGNKVVHFKRSQSGNLVFLCNVAPSERSLQPGAHQALRGISTECVINSHLHFSNFLLQTSSLFWAFQGEKHKEIKWKLQNFLCFPSPLTQGTQKQSRRRSFPQLTFLLSFSLNLWPWPYISMLFMCLVWKRLGVM